jgi:undecaprenyl-diphosphatase
VIEFLYSIDKALFVFINQALSNPAGDLLWPLITNYDRLWAIRVPLVIAWVALLVFGGRKGRTVAIMIPFVLFISDKISSAFIKEWVGRARPCHEIDGVRIIQGIHMLVDCGPGKAFPSSHAVNNFAIGTIFASYYPRAKWAFFGCAGLVALSRVAVGVHYPSDIVGGAIIGFMIAFLVILTWRNIEERFFMANKQASPAEGKSR